MVRRRCVVAHRLGESRFSTVADVHAVERASSATGAPSGDKGEREEDAPASELERELALAGAGLELALVADRGIVALAERVRACAHGAVEVLLAEAEWRLAVNDEVPVC